MHVKKALLAAAITLGLYAQTGHAFEARLVQDAFNPSRGEVLYLLADALPGDLALEVLTPDGHPLRTLSAAALTEGSKLYEAVTEALGAAPSSTWRSVFVWDGKDSDGMVVPDEGYSPRVRRNGEILLDPRNKTGGRTLEPMNVQLTADGVVLYTLPERARVLVRLGIRGGPLVRTPVQWAIKPAGANRQGWDGLDASGVARVQGHPELAALVLAHSLPDHTMVTTGNAGKRYLAYLEERNLEQPEAPADILFERDGQRITQQYWLPRWQVREPAVEFSVVTSDVQRSGNTITLDKPVTFRVSMSDEDAYVMGLSQYEVAFFIDYEFFAEEETGYVPLQWQLRPEDLDPGRHTLMVNVAGLWGHVGVAALTVLVPEP